MILSIQPLYDFEQSLRGLSDSHKHISQAYISREQLNQWQLQRGSQAEFLCDATNPAATVNNIDDYSLTHPTPPIHPITHHHVPNVWSCAGEEGRFAAGSFDSLSAVELSNAVSGAVGLRLPGTLVFDYPCVTALAAHVHSLLTPSLAVELPAASGQQAAAPIPMRSGVRLEVFSGSSLYR